MSQVIKKFALGGTAAQPRLYKRGNDNINLDVYIRNAESGFGLWLADSGLKNKEKQQVQDAYSQILQGINDGTFTYNLGGGFTNTVGMANKEKGFDAAGLAAGYLGTLLRKQSIYKAPEEKPDSSKIEWKGNSSIGLALTRRLYGNDKGNLEDFIDIDRPDPKTNKRGNAKRSARFKSELEYIRNNFDNLFTSFTDSDKATALENINFALSAFNNGTVEDDEYLDLGRATGISNLRDMFSSGEMYKSTPQTPDTASQGTGDNDGSESVYANENTQRATKYPKLNTSLAEPVSLNDPTIYGQWSRQALYNHLKKLDTQTLFDLINFGLSKKVKLYQNPEIVSYAGIGNKPIPFTNKYIINTILKILKDTRNLSQYADISGNQFYIKDSYDKKRGTGLVWDMSNNTINEVNIYDIPWWITKMHNDPTAQVPSNKNGGRLRKFDIGGKATGILKFNPKRNNIYYTGDFTGYDNWHAHNIVLPWLNAYENSGGVDWEPLIRRGLESWNKAGGFDWYNATDEQRKHGMQSAGTQTHQQYVIKYLSGLNTEIAKHISSYNVPIGANTDDRFVNGTLKGTDTDFGIQTGNRRPTIHINTSGQDLADWDAFYQNLGYVGRYQYLDHWVPTKNAEQEGLVAFAQPEPNALAPNQTATEDNTPQEEHSDVWKKIFGSKINETFLPSVSTIPKNNFLSELLPDLTGAKRLWYLSHGNNRIYNTMFPSLKPLFKGAQWRHSPVTGAFGLMQLTGRQGNEGLFQASRPFTSDAYLAAARMLEAQEQANELQTKEFIADDQEIRRTKAEALARHEYSMDSELEAANFNKASANKTDREQAQLTAAHLQSIQKGRDNFLQGSESRTRTRLDENRKLINNFYSKIAANRAEKWYTDVTEPARIALEAQQKTHSGSVTEMEGWTDYVNFMREARDRYRDMIDADIAKIYGMPYQRIYTDESNALFNWNKDTFT